MRIQYGTGRKVAYFPTWCVLREGNFKDEELNGFGRVIDSFGDCVMGWFRESNTVHGVGRKIKTCDALTSNPI